mmetsp:Transcript_7285/g.7856  ORF Transcript_7285/g.7856 Transcript_7285/m.7856 type:complete len:109 (+) Transcript_7285:103-429(+)
MRLQRNNTLSSIVSLLIVLFSAVIVSEAFAATTTTTTTTRKRELRLIRANVENLPLRGLVLFSQGAFTFKWLDFLVCLMNGYYWKGIKSIFFSFALFRSSEKKKKKSN